MKLRNITVNFVYKEKIRELIWLIAFLAILKPEYLATFDLFDDVCNVIRVVIFCVVLTTVLITAHISKRLLCVIGYVIVPLIVTIFNNGDIYKAISVSVVLVTTFMMFENDDYEKLHQKVKVLNVLLVLILLIDVATIYLFPKGLYKLEMVNDIAFYTDAVWFLGYKNNHPPYYLLACFTSVLCWERDKKNKKKFLIVVFVHLFSLIGVVKMMAGSGIYAIIIYFLILVLFVRFKNLKFTFEGAVGVHIVLFLLFTTLPYNSIFLNVFSVIGKVGTMTKRSNIWFNVWERIAHSPLWGYGYENSIDLLWLQQIAAGAVTSHNSFLDVLFRGGIITMIMFVALAYQIGKGLKRIKGEKYRLYNYFVIIFFSGFLTAQTEGFMTSAPLFTLLAILANISPIEEHKKRKIRLKL